MTLCPADAHTFAECFAHNVKTITSACSGYFVTLSAVFFARWIYRAMAKHGAFD